VPGKVFTAGSDALGLQGPDDGTPQPGDFVGLFRERAIADDRILRIRVHVEDRCVVQCDPDCFQFGSQRTGESFGQRHAAAATERRHRRPFSEGRLQPCDASAFLVDGHPDGKIVDERRRFVRDLRHLFGIADVPCEEDNAAEAELFCQRAKLARDLMPIESSSEQLANLAADRARHGYKF